MRGCDNLKINPKHYNMKSAAKWLMTLLFMSVTSLVCAAVGGDSFNADWRFLKGDASDAQSVSFDDSKWRELNLPHDWAIEGPFDIKYNARCGGLPFHGTGWYRKSFVAPKEWGGKVVKIDFEGAMSEAQVWINGVKVGDNKYGYLGFEVDITKNLKLGENNIIAVKLTPRDLSSRWYPGAGLYRDVWVKVDEMVHIDRHGVSVTTPTATKHKAVVQVETTLRNESTRDGKFTVEHLIIDVVGQSVAKMSGTIEVAAGETRSGIVYTDLKNPSLWDLYNPYLYTVETTVKQGEKVIDKQSDRFGVRHIEFTKEGFFLNGNKIRFNGVCLHHDNGPLGGEYNRRADERKLQILMNMGVNAIRTTHNPFAEGFIDLCDEMGLLVISEAFDEWKIGKVENGYHLYFERDSERDLTEFIKRDRNSPSIIMWSLGNEILEQGDKKQGFTVAKRLADICRNVDPTRPSTAGFNYYPAPFVNNMAQQIDIAGMNYKPAVYGKVQEEYPHLLIYGSETSSCTSSRGVYHLPIEKYQTHESLQVTSYDLIGPPWAYPPDMEFHFLEQNPRIMGEFIWTGFDYLGEPTPYGGRDNSTNGYWNGHWPSRSSYFGAVDLCGLPKDRYYLYQSQWADRPMVHVLPHWNWERGQTIPVYVYTNCQEAELFLNGKSLGKRVKGKDKTTINVSFNHFEPKTFDSPYRLSWDVPYEAGTLTVKAYNLGRLVVETEVKTAGKPARIVMDPDRSVISNDGKDLSYITVRVEDKDGNLCPNADNLVDFQVSGAAKFKAVGNGNAATTESFIEPKRKAFSGMCMLIIQSKEGVSGDITVKATSKGLKGQTIKLSAM